MAKVFNYITINYEKDIYTPSIDMMQGDTGRGLIFNIASPIDGLESELSNLTATLNVVKPTGETQTVTGTIESLGNGMAKITVEPSSDLASAIDVSGLANATLVIANTTQTVTSFNFKIKIKPNPFYPKPTVRKFDVTKVSRITGVQQYEHCVQSIEFVGLDYTGNMYIVLNNDTFVQDSETEGYHNTVPLTNNTFIIGQPMTFYSGVFSCQLLGETTSNGETTKFEISPVFQIVIDESLKQGEETQYPIDPNVKIGIDSYVAEKESEIDDYVDNVIESIPSDYTTLEQATYNAYPVQSESGNPIYFDDGADDIPVKELIVNLEPKQSGSGDPSPNNVRPITGYDGVKVKRTGKNILKMPTYEEWRSLPVEDNYRNVAIKCMPNTRYCLNTTYLNGYDSIGKGIYVLLSATKSREYWRSIAHSAQGAVNGTIMTDSNGVIYLAIYYSTSESAWNELLANSQSQLELGSEATEYEPYQGQEYSITFPSEAGTVFGGRLNVTTGVLTVDRYYLHVDPTKIPDNYIHFDVLTNNARVGSMRFDSHFNAPFAKYDASLAKVGAISNWLSERLRGYSVDETGFYIYDYRSFYMFFPKNIFSAQTATAFKQYLTDNPLYICYELQTPTTIQLTPTEVTTLLGSNTIQSDGSMELEYRADISKVIEKLTNAIVSLGGNV